MNIGRKFLTSFLIVFGNMLPFIIGLIIVWIWNTRVEDLYKQGEFYIYSTAFFISSCNIFHEKNPVSKFHYILIIMSLLSATVYALLKANFLIFKSNNLNTEPISYSFIILIISIISFLIANFVKSSKPNLYKKEKKNIKKLRNDFDGLEEK
jgi:uncharacterized membrane protein